MASRSKRSRPRSLTATLYTYVEPQISVFARKQGAKTWGSFSNYINYLLAREAGDKRAMERSKLVAKESGQPTMARVAKKTPKKYKRSVVKTLTGKGARVRLVKKAKKKHKSNVIKLARRISSEAKKVVSEAKAA